MPKGIAKDVVFACFLVVVFTTITISLTLLAGNLRFPTAACFAPTAMEQRPDSETFPLSRNPTVYELAI